MKKNVFYLLTLMLFISIKGFAQNYFFTSHAAIQNFYNSFNVAGGRIDADTLWVTGGDVTQNDINDLESCFKTVNKLLRFEGFTLLSDEKNDDAGVRHLDSFLANVTLNGSIVLKNIPNLGWGGPQGFMGDGLLPAHVKGDLILDSINMQFPGYQGWSDTESFGNIEQVDGDLIIGSRYSNQAFNTSSFTQLQSVGGSFKLYITGTPWIWNIPALKLVSIGGDFEMRGPEPGMFNDDGTFNPNGQGNQQAGCFGLDDKGVPIRLALWAVDILKNVQSIGGNVTIVNCPAIQIGEGSNDGHSEGTGYCYVRYLIDTGVINYACQNVILGWEDEPIDLSAFGPCLWNDGNNQDDPAGDPLPDKDPNCAQNGIPTVKAAPAFATVQPTYVKDNLNITSTTDLAKVDIIDIAGRTVKSFTAFTADQKSLPLSNLTNGIYLVRLISVNNEVQTVKIIKQ